MWTPSALQVLSLLVFWGQMQNYMMRQNLSILIVAMVKESPNDDGDASGEAVAKESCVDDTEIKSDGNNSQNFGGEFEWDAMTRGLVLSAFGYGYVTTQLIGGRLAERFGVKAVYGRCLAVCGVLTLLSPAAAKLGGAWALAALRVLQGVAEGVTFPSLHAMTARWVPNAERNSFVARSYFGSTFGLIVTYPLCGFLAAKFGWESAFYTVGAITCAWYLAWYLLVFDTPEKHPRIDSKEKERIMNALEAESHLGKGDEDLAVPWKSIFTSVPFYGLLITDTCNCWGLYTMATNVPSYFKFMLGLDVASTGVLAALPMLCRYVGGIALAATADKILKARKLSRTNVRRVFNSISQGGSALAMALMAFSGCNVSYAMTVLCVGWFLNGALASSHMVSHMDLSPNFAGTLFGITNTFSGGATSFIVPTVIGAITSGNMTFAAWRTVFLLAAAVYFAGNLAYVAMISGEVQEWNFPQDDLKKRAPLAVEEKLSEGNVKDDDTAV